MPDFVQQYKALANPTRLRLTALLAAHELSVNELASILGAGQSGVSQNLKVLVECGLAVFRRDGSRSFYSAAKEGPGRVFLDCQAPVLRRQNGADRDLAAADSAIKERAEATRRFFNQIAGQWDALRSEVLAGFDLAGVLSRLLTPVGVAVDLGCGTGALLPVLLQHAGQVIGVDSSRAMLEKAQKNLAGNGETVSLRLGEMEHLPLADGEADLALACLTLHHLANPENGVAEAARVLAPGGRLIVVDFAKHGQEAMRTKFGDHWLGFSSDEIELMTRGLGLEGLSQQSHRLKSGLTLVFYSVGKA